VSSAPLHWSDLRHMQESAAHYQWHMTTKRAGAGREPSPAMRLGTLANHLVLGATAHGTQFAVWEGGIRRGKAWDAFCEENPGREVVNLDEVATAEAIRGAVTAHPTAQALLTSGAIEAPLSWTVAGRACAGTPDVLGSDHLVEFKVTHNANPSRFLWHAIRMGWLGQLAWYADGADYAGLEPPRSLHIVAVESKPPHVVTVFDLTDLAVEFGRRQWRGLFERLLVCERTDRWPGYCATSVPLDAPDSDELFLDIDGEEVDVA
jgi:hypothetical protein